MRFSIYSEMQLWPGKSPERLYAEVEEQIVHADRLGYDAYAIVEHFFFPRFSISPDPLALFAQVAPRTQRIRFRTMLHVLPFHNPTVLASRIAAAQILTGGRYEFGVGRGHGWVPPKAGVRIEDVRELYDESFEIFFKALENERFSHEGRFYEVHDSHLAPPPPPAATRVFVGGTSDSTYELAGRRGWAVAVPPLLPYEALRGQLDIYRQSCAEHGNEPDIVWIHACYMDEDREVAKRDAEQAMRRFLEGNASPLAGARPRRGAAGRRLRVLHLGDHGAARRDALRRDDRRRHRVGRHARGHRRAGRRDHRRLRGTDRDRDHRQPRRLRALAGDQDAGDLRRRGGARFRSTDPAATGAAREIATHA